MDWTWFNWKNEWDHGPEWKAVLFTFFYSQRLWQLFHQVLLGRVGSTAWFMKYSHVHRSCCSPTDKSSVLLMQHFQCCHSGLFWCLLLWMGWFGENATRGDKGRGNMLQVPNSVNNLIGLQIQRDYMSNQLSCSNKRKHNRICSYAVQLWHIVYCSDSAVVEWIFVTLNYLH